MSVSDRTFLTQLGFPLPNDSGTDCPPVAWQPEVPDDLRPFLSRVKARIAGRPLSELVFLEFFCGSGGLCVEVRKKGLSGSRGIDHQAGAGVKCPVISIDLATASGHSLALEMLTRQDVVACHFAPPCGTASAARSIPGRNAPLPLRTSQAPDGVPDLRGLDLTRVSTANKLYSLVASLVNKCNELGILWCIENPNRSLFWATKPITSLLRCPHLCTRLHHCMFGSQRRKHTLLCHAIPFLQVMQVSCDGSHEHLPWGRLPNGGWATKAEVAYPPLMCRCLAHSFVSQLQALGAKPLPPTLHDAELQPARAAQVATSHQPSKRLPPLVSEYAYVVTVTGPASLVPSALTLDATWHLASGCTAQPSVQQLPAGSKRLSSFPARGDPEGRESIVTTKFGVPWSPADFVAQAIKCKHPKLLASALPAPLKECIDHCVSRSPVEIARERTANLRQWMLRAKELNAEGEEPLVSSHCKDILANKSMKLLGEMIHESGYGDSKLPRDIGKGFDLLGPIPDSSGVLPKKATYASLSVPEVREVAHDNQKCVWQAVLDSAESMSAEDMAVAAEIYKLTLAERDEHWVEGPFFFFLGGLAF